VTATDSVSASTSQNFTLTINPGSVAKYVVTIPGSATFQAGNGFLVSVQAADQFGNFVTLYSGPPTATAGIAPSTAASNFPGAVPINGNGFGLFLGKINQAGTYTINVASGSISGSAGPITITPGPAARLAFGTEPVTTPTGDALPPVTVQVEDLYGNVV